MKSLSFPLCSLIATALFATAQPVDASLIWSKEYQGYQLLETPWTVSGGARMDTGSDETWLQINGSQGTAYVEMKAPTFAPETQATLQFSLSIVKEGSANWAQGAAVFLDGYFWEILIDVNRVTFRGADAFQYTAPIGLNVEREYLLVITGATASLYVDSSPIAQFQNISGNTGQPGLSQILRLGKYGSAATGDGRWDNVRWHNTEAIPEPGSVALILGGAVIFGGAALRRKQ